MNSIRGSRSGPDMGLRLMMVAVLLLCAFIATGESVKRGRDDVDEDNKKSEMRPGPEERTGVRLPRVFDFKEYAMRFHKAYGTTELMAKANLFLARVINIFKHNAKFLQNDYDYFLGLNAFTDISAVDFDAMSIKGDPAMGPVSETKFFPANMPATELPSVQQLTGSMGFSMSAADDDELSTAAYEARYGGNRAATKKSIVDFTKDGAENASVSIRDFYREFKRSVRQQEDAERLSRVVDLNKRLEAADHDHNQDDHVEEGDQPQRKLSDPKSERAMIRRKIKYSPVVRSNNKNYDGMNIVSHGVYDNLQAGRAFSKTMASFLDYDVDIMEDLKPYESPSKRTRIKTDPEEEEEEDSDSQPRRSFFSSFFSTAKDLAKSVASNLLLDNVFEFEDLDELDDETTDEIDQKTREQNEANAKKIKYKVDWRVTGCITKPKSQDACNACYAFTVLGLMEYYYCRQTRELTEFSAQYIVDCGHRTGLKGCKTGYLGKVGKFISLYGLELQSMYPFSGVDGQCPYQPNDSKKMGYLRPKILNWVYIEKMSDWYEHVRKGPLLVGIGMPSDFLAYAGGIHDGNDCDPQRVHAMLLVGSGSQGGKEFWLFKNSFSDDWGENGYFRLAKDAPLKCFNAGVVVRVTFNQEEVKNPDYQKPAAVGGPRV